MLARLATRSGLARCAGLARGGLGGAALRAGALGQLRLCSGATAPPRRFAVVELGGTQYKVAADDVICVEKMAVDVGSVIQADRVLLVGSESATIIGSPLIKDACVEATVEEQTYGEKVIVFKKKRRNGYQRWKGHRSPLTVLRINDIQLPSDLDEQLQDR